MIRIDHLEQGSPEWLAARCGIPTASEFGNIITPEGRKSGAFDGYLNRLAQEAITGQPAEHIQTGWMARGNRLEQEARQWYEIIHWRRVETTGIVYRDDRRDCAASPDALMPDLRRGLEIKSPKISTFAEWSLRKRMPMEHRPQVQGNLLITGYESWDFMAYHPRFQPWIVTVEPDPKYQKILTGLLNRFIEKLAERIDRLRQREGGLQ